MRETLDLLIPYVKKHRTEFLLLNLTTLVGVISQVLIPLQISSIIDEVLTELDRSLLVQGFLIILGYAFIDLKNLDDLKVNFLSDKMPNNENDLDTSILNVAKQLKFFISKRCK